MNNERAQQAARELQLLESERSESVLFHGNSMLPFLQDGDSLRVVPVAWDEIQRGDIITYRLRDHFPTLRVAAKYSDQLVLTADNWRGRTFQAWREHVLGRVVARTRKGATLTADALPWKWQTQRWLRRVQTARIAARARGLPHRMRAHFSPPRRYDRPPNLQINVSSDCNLKCRMCPYLGVHGNPAHLDFMTRETFERILPTIREIGAVHFSGSGEPLFHRELFEFMAQVRNTVPDARIDLTTNGTLLTEARAQRLIALGVNKVHISFDGLPGRVETIRRNIKGSQVLENVRRLNELKRAQASHLPIVQVNYMMGYGTYWDLVEFILLARKIGVAEIQLLEMQPATAEDAANNLLNGTLQDGGAALKTAIMLAQYYNIRLHLPTVTSNVCHFPSNPHIGEDGEVYPCCFLDYDGRQLFDGTEHRFEPMKLGNINTTFFDSIWNSPGYVAFRERNARGDLDANCQTCYNIRARTWEHIRQIIEPRA